MTPTLTVLSGLSGAGKSTLARQIVEETNAVLVSRDELHKAVVSLNCVATMNELMVAATVLFLMAGRSVVVDAWNLHPGDRRTWEAVAERRSVPLIWRHLATPVAVCIERDAHRPNPVGGPRITAAAREYGIAA